MRGARIKALASLALLAVGCGSLLSVDEDPQNNPQTTPAVDASTATDANGGASVEGGGATSDSASADAPPDVPQEPVYPAGTQCGAALCPSDKICCVSADTVKSCTTVSDCQGFGGARIFGCDGPEDCPGAACCLHLVAGQVVDTACYAQRPNSPEYKYACRSTVGCGSCTDAPPGDQPPGMKYCNE